MINVVIRLVSTWMTDPDTGINAQLRTVPLSDTAIERPGDIELFNALDDNWVARGTIPSDKLKDGPVIVIGPVLTEQSPVRFPMLPDRQKGKDRPEVLAQITALQRSSASATQQAHAELALRASLRVIALKFDSASTEYSVDGVGVALGITPADLFLRVPNTDERDDKLMSVIAVPFTVHDTWALGIS